MNVFSFTFRRFLLLLVLVSPSGFALDPVYTSFISNVAISGYDPVAYFTDGAAYKGKSEFEYEWKGAKWRFYTEENKNKFVLDPEAYEPQFGGYCAYAIGLGKSASSDPSQFTIVNGKLYLNYNSRTKILWAKEQEKFISQAEQNWPKLIAEDLSLIHI